jgi:GNAT superfamily N-acetyltransferase
LQDISILYSPSNTRELHSWIAILNNECVGNIHLQIEPNYKVKFLDAWVHKGYRRKGIYRRLWEVRWEYVQENLYGYTAYAWCKPMSLSLLIEKGFKGGETCIYVEKIIAE